MKIKELFKHRHKWQVVDTAHDLQIGVFAVTAWCKCGEVTVKTINVSNDSE